MIGMDPRFSGDSVVSVTDVNRFDQAPYPDLFDRAAQVRAARDAFQAEVEAGGVPLTTLFARGTSVPEIATMKVLGVVEGLPDYGKVQTRRAFGELGISEAAHIGHVTDDQIAALPAALQRHAR